jgi:hypothetical protein
MRAKARKVRPHKGRSPFMARQTAVFSSPPTLRVESPTGGKAVTGLLKLSDNYFSKNIFHITFIL